MATRKRFDPQDNAGAFSVQRILTGLWPSPARATLPAQVAASIEKNDDLSEVLVRLIQFTVFALWGLFYLAAPKPNPDTVSQVPWVISFYLCFTLATLLVAVFRRLPRPIIYASILIDMAMLTYLIWSFHIQYDQPASFSLKVVEVANYFVLIGLRVLRFEARFVVAAGLTAASCWGLLVYYTVAHDPVDPMITRDYVTYLTSNSVLIGAEVSKIISMLMFTAILAIAVRRAHTFLVTSVAEGSAAQSLSRFMAETVAEQIRDADHQIQAGEGMRRDVAILNVDIRDFTTLAAQMQPDEAMSLLSDYQHQVVPIIHKHNGVVDKFMGDGILATFGAARHDPNYCANTLKCMDEILASKESWTGPASHVVTNLAAVEGPVIYGAVGDGDRLEFTVIGSHVNIAAKLEKLNKKLGTTALSGRKLYDKAIQQGYQPKRDYRSIEFALSDKPKSEAQFQAVVVAEGASS